jgi:magnesium-transporting ATPase (P-type)
MSYRMGYDYKKFRNKDHIVKIFPFSSERKKMATVYQDDKGAIYVFVKGAPDFLTPYCSKFVNKNGNQHKMTT